MSLRGAGWKVGDRERSRLEARLFKVPAFDLVSIAMMGLGILLLAAMVLTF
jgi:hypothetical protein